MDYDPTIEDTGLGGTSQGAYDLRLNFRSQVGDGEHDQRSRRRADPAGRRRRRHCRAASTTSGSRPGRLNRVVDVTGDGSRFVDGQMLTLTNSQGRAKRFEFDSNGTRGGGQHPRCRSRAVPRRPSPPIWLSRLADADQRRRSGISATATRQPHHARSASVSLRLSSGFTGMAIHGKTIFVDKTAGPNADGSLGQPFNNISRHRRHQRLRRDASRRHRADRGQRRTGRQDRRWRTISPTRSAAARCPARSSATATNGRAARRHRDGRAGTIFKLRRSYIGVGSSSLTVDRSGGALQVLGTPQPQGLLHLLAR